MNSVRTMIATIQECRDMIHDISEELRLEDITIFKTTNIDNDFENIEEALDHLEYALLSYGKSK